MARQRSTLGKLQRDQAKRDKAKAKQEDRANRREERETTVATVGDGSAGEDQSQVLEEFARLHDDYADGRISLEEFETRQEELRSRLRID